MSVRIFLSTVSDEFRAYRDQLRADLTRHNVEVKVQEDFKDLGGDTLDKLDVYIAQCDAVVHLVGDMTGSEPSDREQRALLAKYPDLTDQLWPLGEALTDGVGISYTQWEAWLALYHSKLLLTAKAEETASRGPKYAPTPESRPAQVKHLARLEAFGRYPGCVFASAADLAKHIAYTAILDLLVNDYAQAEARERAVAEGFIREMAKKVAGDQNLDFDGMKEAVRNAIEIYEKEIAGGRTETNYDAIVDEALKLARRLADAGKSRLAAAALHKAAEALRRDEEERHEQYVSGVTALYHRARDIALAAYDGEAAAEAIVAQAEAIYGANSALGFGLLNTQATNLYEYGTDRGSNVHLVGLIALRRKLLALASLGGELGVAHHNLGDALAVLGARESGTARLNEAVAAYRQALKERTRERAPRDWAGTQNSLGLALWRLGERDGGTARLNEAVAAYREALKERTRERAPLDWARVQNNLGNALTTLGERESDTARLEQAVAAFREALNELTRERAPLDWAATQNNLGSALQKLGSRESGATRLNEAATAFREALKERTRGRLPLEWAATQNNLGNTLRRLGELESGTKRLYEAVAAFREALKERTRERVPLQWAGTQNNLGNALSRLGAQESGTTRLEEAVWAYRAALEEWTRERVPLDWAGTKNNLGLALATLGTRKSDTARLEEAVAAFREALKEWTRERAPLDWAMTQDNLGSTLQTLGDRQSGTARLDEALAAYNEALQERTRERVPIDWAMTLGNQGVAMSVIAERRNDLDMATLALDQIETALSVMRNAGHVPAANYYATQVPQARALVERLRKAHRKP